MSGAWDHDDPGAFDGVAVEIDAGQPPRPRRDIPGEASVAWRHVEAVADPPKLLLTVMRWGLKTQPRWSA
ncbi:hypothetical protein GCM10009555_101680 [Acrocarpospora macrocephala]|uniref:Uncharacterized protein n=1 Tax=Acrocarpospora macrocephala TaxID=150177 RepID=A0A5M3WG50_9ACTN|nr:hypothetical protein Amac_006870 [Acrocarpospora macrocephala]